MQSGAVQCNAVQCIIPMQCSSPMQCNAVQYAMRCNAVQSAMQYPHEMQCSAVSPCNAMQCSAEWGRLMQCSAVQCGAVQDGEVASFEGKVFLVLVLFLYFHDYSWFTEVICSGDGSDGRNGRGSIISVTYD